jgi:hypothetical protein
MHGALLLGSSSFVLSELKVMDASREQIRAEQGTQSLSRSVAQSFSRSIAQSLVKSRE